MIALHPPEALLLTIQKHLLDFFWGGKHWVKPEVLYLPLSDGGHGLIDILSRWPFESPLSIAFFFLHHCHGAPLLTIC